LTRFDYDGEEGMPWELWETVVSNALGGRRGQEALAAMEDALLALPEPKLVHGHLASDSAVCAVGALVAHRRAEREAVDVAAVIEAMSAGVKCWCGHGREAHAGGGCTAMRKPWGETEERPCSCEAYEPDTEDVYETVRAGEAEGLSHTVAWHLAYLNDETFGGASPEERFNLMLAWVRRAQGKEAVAA
jgi:hypothetical protein